MSAAVRVTDSDALCLFEHVLFEATPDDGPTNQPTSGGALPGYVLSRCPGPLPAEEALSLTFAV